MCVGQSVGRWVGRLGCLSPSLCVCSSVCMCVIMSCHVMRCYVVSCTYVCVYACMHVKVYACMGWMDGWMDGQTRRRMDDRRLWGKLWSHAHSDGSASQVSCRPEELLPLAHRLVPLLRVPAWPDVSITIISVINISIM